MNQIQGKIIADSISPQGHRITTMLVVFPRFILAELNTHRMLSRNSASSRAIPFDKMVEMVKKDPFIPIAWQKDHKGMQGSEYLIHTDANVEDWLKARDYAIEFAENLNNGGFGVTKQLCNRLLEPFMWHTVLITATDFNNFFELRCPKYELGSGVFKSKKDAIKVTNIQCGELVPPSAWTNITWLQRNKSQAEIHIQALAESMWDCYNESIPKELSYGEWHLPLARFVEDLPLDVKIKTCVARAARLSYANFDGKIDYEKDIKLHDQLLENKHFSCFEHCARVMSDLEYNEFVKTKLGKMSHEWDYGWCNNFQGFIPYRYLVENKQI